MHDNFIGSTPQPNAPLCGDWAKAEDNEGTDWPGFFIKRRLRYQVDLAVRKGHGAELSGLLDVAEGPINRLLSEAVESPSLLHGDLWSGNYMVDELGMPCLIDPAVYYGHREADLAMTRLFGGFEPAFYEAYMEAFPLAQGHEERLPVYQLYHLLNHLNLFGRSYLAQCMNILKASARM
jgi:fructosamine-3-kinase